MAKAVSRKRFNRRHREPLVKRAARTFLKSLKFLAAVSILPSLAYGGHYLYNRILTTGYLAVSSIEVRGLKRVARESVLELSGIREGENILSLSVKDAEEGVRKNPWVEHADVSRRLPGRVRVQVTERSPLALVKMDGLYVMDEKGVIFKRLEDADRLDLPIVTGIGAEVLSEEVFQAGLLELMHLLRTRKGFGSNDVSEIHVDPVYGFALYTLEDGVMLSLGVGRYEEKLRAFERIQKMRGGLSGIEAMDLNNDAVVIVRFYSDVVKEGGAI